MLKHTLAKLFLRRSVLFNGSRPDKVYLTFDDGPNPRHTPGVLDVLDRHGVKATFFMVGVEVHQNRELAQEVVRRGHRVANHSLTHPRMDRLSNDARALEVDGMDAVLSRFGPSHLRGLFRPPYGHASIGLMAMCMRMRRTMVMWTRDSFDFKWSADEVVAGFERQPPRPGDILLFHDDSGASAPALDRLLPAWKAMGLEFDLLAPGAGKPRMTREGTT